MADTIQIRRSTTPGATPGVLQPGELAVNLADHRLYIGGGAAGGYTLTSGGGGSSGLIASGTFTLAQNASATLTHVEDASYLRVVALADYVPLPPTDVIPVMTGPTTAGCTITANPNPSGYEGWRACDASTIGSGSAWAYPSGVGWLIVALSSTYTIVSYTLMARDYANIGPKEWALSGSDDGVTWTQIDHRTVTTWGASEKKTFTLASPVTFSQFKLDILQTFPNGYTYTFGIVDFELLPFGTTEVLVPASGDYKIKMTPTSTTVTRLATGTHDVAISVRL